MKYLLKICCIFSILCCTGCSESTSSSSYSSSQSSSSSTTTSTVTSTNQNISESDAKQLVPIYLYEYLQKKGKSNWNIGETRYEIGSVKDSDGYWSISGNFVPYDNYGKIDHDYYETTFTMEINKQGGKLRCVYCSKLGNMSSF